MVTDDGISVSQSLKFPRARVSFVEFIMMYDSHEGISHLVMFDSL